MRFYFESAAVLMHSIDLLTVDPRLQALANFEHRWRHQVGTMQLLSCHMRILRQLH